MRYWQADRTENSLPMQMYSPEELDVMAEAYHRALDKAPRGFTSTKMTLQLVQEIAWGVANGLRDKDTLARIALKRTGAGGGI
jgi:hypothetical protein